jgi:hypothetical protein
LYSEHVHTLKLEGLQARGIEAQVAQEVVKVAEATGQEEACYGFTVT